MDRYFNKITWNKEIGFANRYRIVERWKLSVGQYASVTRKTEDSWLQLISWHTHVHIQKCTHLVLRDTLSIELYTCTTPINGPHGRSAARPFSLIRYSLKFMYMFGKNAIASIDWRPASSVLYNGSCDLGDVRTPDGAFYRQQSTNHCLTQSEDRK